SDGSQGVVLAQSPASGSTVRKGSTVEISIPTPTNQVPVPNLSGLTASQADAQLSGQGLSVGSLNQQCSNSIPADLVSGSSPSAGQEVARGSAVNLTTSSGNCSIIVQGVLGSSAADATGVLTGQG